MRQNQPSLKQPTKPTGRTKPRYIVTRTYGGGPSMRDAFEQAMENQAGIRFEQWKNSKNS